MDLRKKKSNSTALAEFILRLRWVWILTLLIPMAFQAYKSFPLLSAFLDEVRMQHRFTLQFLVRKDGGIATLLKEVFSVGEIFIVPIGFTVLGASVFKNRLMLLAFPLIFVSLWQLLFLNADLQLKFALILFIFAFATFMLIGLKQNSGAFILPMIILAAILFLFNLGSANSIRLNSMSELLWQFELLITLLIADMILLSLAVLKYLKQGKPKLAAIVNALQENLVPWGIRNLALIFLTGFWLKNLNSEMIIPLVYLQSIFIISSMMISCLVFPALLSLAPFQTPKK